MPREFQHARELLQVREGLLSIFGFVRRRAARAAAKLFATIKPHLLPHVDRLLRDSWIMTLEWEGVKAEYVGRLATIDEGNAAVLGLVCCHPNGYVRHEGVKRIAALFTTGAELPFLLLRCNDWVLPVRQFAFDAVEARLRPEYCPYFIQYLPLLLAREHHRHADYGKLQAKVAALLSSDAARPLLEAAMQSTDVSLRRSAFEIANRFEIPLSSKFVEWAVANPDAGLRYQAIKVAATPGRGALPLPLLEHLIHDRVPAVRRFAWTALTEYFPIVADDLVEEGLLDTNWTVRALAQHERTKCPGGFDAREFYTSALSRTTGRQLAGALRALADEEARDRVPLIERFISDAVPDVRKAALFAMAKLGAPGYVALLTRASQDPSRSVALFAERLLLKHCRA